MKIQKQKKLIIIIALVISFGGGALFAQTGDYYRMASLDYFCQHKYEIFRLNNPIFEGVEPLFFLDLWATEDDSTISFYIDSSLFNPDTSFVENILAGLKKEDVIINENDFQISSSTGDPNVFVDYYDCIYLNTTLKMLIDTIPASIEEKACRREYGLSLSRVIPYKGMKYVILRISSYFKAKVDKCQFCLMEFSHEGDLLRCGVGRVWMVD